MVFEGGAEGHGDIWRRASNKELCDMDRKFDAEFGQMEKAAACQTRSTYRRLATAFDEAELDLNGGLLKIHQLVAATASATGDRMENEHGYLENALRILNMIQKRGGGRVQTYCRDGKTNK